MRSLILQIFAIYSICGQENPVPSEFLQPRDFNPHPYQVNANFISGYNRDEFDVQELQQKFQELSRRVQNTAPIQFPVNAERQNQLQQTEQQRKIISHIIDNQAVIPHPYQKLALNYRAQQLQRYNGNDDQASQLFSALASHGRKVKNNEFQRKMFIPTAKQTNRIDNHIHVDPVEHSSSNHEKKHYRFSYAVKDGHSGDDFSHTQKQENGAVHGSYKVHLPDGRVQVVKYTADDIHGYRAEVTYENEPQEHLVPSPQVENIQTHFYPKSVKQVGSNSLRYTVTPTPYTNDEYNIRSPSVRGYYPSTTSVPRHYY